MHTTLDRPDRVLLAALALGVCADQLFYGRWLGLSAPLFVALCLLALGWLSLREGRPPARGNLWLGGAALFFAAQLVLRAAPLLAALNLLAAVALLLLLVASFQGTALARLPGWRYLTRLLLALGAVFVCPAPLVATRASTLRVKPRRLHRLLPLLRGLLLALPVLACFAGLLASADGVFASYLFAALSLQLPFDLSALLGHTLLALAAAWVCAGALLLALNPPAALRTQEDETTTELPAEGDTQRLRMPFALGWVEALTVLLAVDGLFGSFLLVQGAYFFGGLDTLMRSGLSYAEYARRGFFELLATACLALALLWSLALFTRRERPWQRHAFNAASAAMIALVLGLLASAFQRMWLYEQAYGYTRLRLYTHSFMVWLALLLLLFLLALLLNRPRLYTFGGFASALLYLAALNIVNPDALIVRENIARYQQSGKLDAYYLATLSTDATPALVEALAELDPDARFQIAEALSHQLATIQQGEAQHGWPSWHLGRARAAAAIGDGKSVVGSQ